MAVPTAPVLIDALQFCRWSRDVFEQMHEAGMSAVHVTVAYHETFRKTVELLVDWHWRFRDHADLILPGRPLRRRGLVYFRRGNRRRNQLQARLTSHPV